MNIAAMAIDFHARPATIQRANTTASYDDKGDPVLPLPEPPIPARVVRQPYPGNKRDDLPEGLRDQANYVFWSRTQLSLDDVIIQQGLKYKLIKLQERDGVFYRAVGTLLREEASG